MTLLTKASDLFDGLKPEEKQEIRDLRIEDNPNLAALIKTFEKVKMPSLPKSINSELYAAYAKHLPVVYTAQDVEQCSVVLASCQDIDDFGLKAGLFLSALINTSIEKTFTLRTSHLDEVVENIGFRNNGSTIIIKGNGGEYVGDQMVNGTIRVEGNVGNCVGNKMSGGTIIVNGNSSENVGTNMSRGEIYINGNVDQGVGYGMEGGEINIKGNVDHDVGHLMKNGIIRIGGNVGVFVGREMSGGKIYINGNLGPLVGFKMSSGKIYVNGSLNLLKEEPIFMTGGDIYRKGVQIVKDGKKLK